MSSPSSPSPNNDNSSDQESLVIRDLCRHLSGIDDDDDHENEESSSAPNYHQVALPVAAIKTLLSIIQRTQTQTMMGLQHELQSASSEIISFANSPQKSTLLLGGRSHIALSSGCDLFLKYITRSFLEIPGDFQKCITQILERGQRFSDISMEARDRIASEKVGMSFIRPGMKVLTHGWSKVVSSLLRNASKHTHFELIILEGRPDASGAKAAAELYADANIPTTIVLDSAMAYVMEQVDIVIVGAEGVVENGGIVNKIGTYGIGICAKEHGVPFYVAAESYKFARLFPLNQRDLRDSLRGKSGSNTSTNCENSVGVARESTLNFVDTACWLATGGVIGTDPNRISNQDKNGKVPGLIDIPLDVKVDNPLCDYTPAKYITLLFTDLGVLTPSAVSDELIKLYQ